MNGDLHFEVVFDVAGQHRVFFSDAVRAALRPAVASSVSLTVEHEGGPAESLTLTPDERTGSWVASGRPLAALAGGKARLAYTRPGAEPYWIDLPIAVAIATPKPGTRGKAKHVHDHPHGAHP